MRNIILFNYSGMKEKRRYIRRKLTKSELILWSEIRNNKLGTKFKRQYSIGPYIADFFSSEQKLVIELDGGYHKNNDQKKYDDYRTIYFKSLGLKVIRFWNSDLRNMSNVTKIIKASLS